jgi:hypothetical protein
VVRRQLQRAAADARYRFGETILTFWPWPNNDFGGGNDCARAIHVAGEGKGSSGHTVTVAMPILYFLGLMARMGPDFHVLPEQVVGGHVVSGFASQNGGRLYLLLYSHEASDTESRSEAAFDVTFDLGGLREKKVVVREYQFDKDHNSYFQLGRQLRDQGPKPARSAHTKEIVRQLQSGEPAAQRAALEELADLGPDGSAATGALFHLIQKSDDPEVRARAGTALKRIMGAKGYPAAVVREIQDLAVLKSTRQGSHEVAANGCLSLHIAVAGNGANFLIIEP